MLPGLQIGELLAHLPLEEAPAAAVSYELHCRMSEGGVQRCRTRSSIITAFIASEILRTGHHGRISDEGIFKPAEP
jgi:hypothetical protein